MKERTHDTFERSRCERSKEIRENRNDGRQEVQAGRGGGKVTSAERRRKGWKPTKPRDESEGNSVLYRAASGPRWVGGSVSRM